MSLSDAASILLTDVQSLQARLVEGGWPVRARLLATGVSGRPSGRGGACPTGIFARFNADGEDYVFTVTGPAAGIERAIMRGHETLQAALARHWPGDYDGETGRPVPPSTEVHETSAGYEEQESNPMPRRRMDRAALHRHTFSIQRRPDGLWTACVCIPTPAGPLYLCATADEHAVAQALNAELSTVSGRPWAGCPDFRTQCGAVAESRATDRLGSSLRQFTRDPAVQSIFQNIVPFVPVVGPAASMAFQGAAQALNVVDKVNAGDPRATEALKAIADKARKGDKKAAKALQTLRMAREAREKGKLEGENKMLLSENDMLKLKLAALDKKWEKDPMDAADDFTDAWGASDEFIGPDVVQAAGNIIGSTIAESGSDPRLARPFVSRYFEARLPEGSRARADISPEVGALYHRPMREASAASARKDYLRGSALQAAGFAAGRHYLAPWEASGSAGR